jgi:non-specific protein-tyrosine kinase
VDLRHLIGIIRSWLPLLVLAGVLAGAGGFIASSLQPKVYAAQASLIVGESLSSSNPNQAQLQVSQSLATTYTAIAKKRPLLQKVSDDINGALSPAQLDEIIEVRAAPDVPILTIAVEDTDPDRAAAVANSLAEALIAASPTVQGREDTFSQSIDDALADTQAMIASTNARVAELAGLSRRTAAEDAEFRALEDRLVELRSTFTTLLGYSSADASNRISIVESAIPSTEVVAPRTLLNTLLAIGVGVAAIFALAFVTEQLDDTVKDPETVQEVTGLSTLGTIARLKNQRGRSEIYRLVALLYPRSNAAEAYRALRSNVEFASVDAPVRSLLVTSSVGGEGKTTTACNLAVVFAQAGRRVLLVDADLRRPGVHTMFDLANATGLTTLLRESPTVIDSVAQDTEVPNLRVITTGPLPPNPAELLGSMRMRSLMAGLLKRADLVVFDSPPVHALADAAVLSSLVDGTLVVIASGHSRRGSVRTTMETLQRAGANVLGVVLNRVAAKSEHGYGGSYGSHEAALDSGGPNAATAATSSGRSTS